MIARLVLNLTTARANILARPFLVINRQLLELPSYGWPKFALKGQIVPFLKSFEIGQKLVF